MIFRIQLNLEVDTETKRSQIITQHVEEGPQRFCPRSGCGKALPMGRVYCSRDCFTAHGHRTQRKDRIVRGASGAQPITHLPKPVLTIAPTTSAPPPSIDYATFSFHPGGSV